MKLKLNSLLLIVVIAVPAFSYDLRPSKTSKYFKDEVHELLTIASVQCKEAMSKSPLSMSLWNCIPEYKNFATDYSNDRWAGIIRGKVRKDDLPGLKMKYLLDGVRWPDDPIGSGRSSIPVRLVSHFFKCEDWLKGSFGACANRFCVSHFGHWQMAHSMKPWLPWCKESSSESSTCHYADGDTQAAIKDWVHWLVKVGKGDANPTDRVLDDDFAERLFDRRNCEDVYPPEFNYESLFFADCSKNRLEGILKFWRWGKLDCNVSAPKDPKELSYQLKERAIGAILHLIQDSYARGHTLRLATTSEVSACSPLISCTKIVKFSDFTQQKFLKHGVADKTPDWDQSCLEQNREVDDPITAGAKVLAMFENGRSADDIWAYLAGKVFNEETLHKTDQVLSQEDEKKKKAIKVAIGKDHKCFGGTQL